MMVVSVCQMTTDWEPKTDFKTVKGRVIYRYGNGKQATFNFECSPDEYSASAIPDSVSVDIGRHYPFIGLLIRMRLLWVL